MAILLVFLWGVSKIHLWKIMQEFLGSNLPGRTLPGEGVPQWNLDKYCAWLSQRRRLPLSSRGSSLHLQNWFPPGQRPASLMVAVLTVHVPPQGGQASLTWTGECIASQRKYMWLPFVPLENTDFWDFSAPFGDVTSLSGLWLWGFLSIWRFISPDFCIFLVFCFWQRKPAVARLVSGPEGHS